MTDAANVSESALAERIAKGDPLFVLYWASWCGYCRMFLPHYERFIGSAPVEAVGADLHDDQDPRWDLAEVDVVPTVLYYVGGVERARLDGRAGVGISPKRFEEFVAAVLAS